MLPQFFDVVVNVYLILLDFFFNFFEIVEHLPKIFMLVLVKLLVLSNLFF